MPYLFGAVDEFDISESFIPELCYLLIFETCNNLWFLVTIFEIAFMQFMKDTIVVRKLQTHMFVNNTVTHCWELQKYFGLLPLY